MSAVPSNRPKEHRPQQGVNEVIHRAQAKLEEHAVFRGRTEQIEMDEQDGTLVLRGTVPTFYVKQVLQTALRNIEGVTEIKNRVDVTWPDWF